jgi:hypothetical protein
MRLVIKNSIELCLRTLVFIIVLRHSNYNNRIISIEGTFLGTPCMSPGYFQLNTTAFMSYMALIWNLILQYFAIFFN